MATLHTQYADLSWEDSSFGETQQMGLNRLKVHSLVRLQVEAGCHLGSQLGLLARVPTHGLSIWSLCFFVAQ